MEEKYFRAFRYAYGDQAKAEDASVIQQISRSMVSAVEKMAARGYRSDQIQACYRHLHFELLTRWPIALEKERRQPRETRNEVYSIDSVINRARDPRARLSSIARTVDRNWRMRLRSHSREVFASRRRRHIAWHMVVARHGMARHVTRFVASTGCSLIGDRRDCPTRAVSVAVRRVHALHLFTILSFSYVKRSKTIGQTQ